jgi:hypothetical protein
VTELVIASGPLRYLGGSIETFALPMGAFIVATLVLFNIYRRPHSVPRLKYLRPAYQVALGTREPGTEGLVYVAPAVIGRSATAPQADAVAPTQDAVAPTQDVVAPANADPVAPADVDAQAPSAAAEESAPEQTSDAEHDGTSAEGETS